MHISAFGLGIVLSVSKFQLNKQLLLAVRADVSSRKLPLTPTSLGNICVGSYSATRHVPCNRRI